MNNKISIIIPCYNAEPFLDKLFDTLLKQTYRNLELIFVNDQSTDNTLNILQKKAEEDTRIIVLNRTTKGGTAAKGIEYAMPYMTGDYLINLTQDDFLDYNFCEKILSKAVEKDADLVFPNLVLYYENKKSINPYPYPPNKNFDIVMLGKDIYYDTLDWKMHGNVFVRKDLIKRTGFKAEYYNSCEYYARIRILNAKKCAFADTTYYYRQDNPNAITKGKTKYFWSDIMIVDALLHIELIKYNYEKKLIKSNRKRIIKSWRGWAKHWAKSIVIKRYTYEHRKYILNNLIKVIQILYFNNKG